MRYLLSADLGGDITTIRIAGLLVLGLLLALAREFELALTLWLICFCVLLVRQERLKSQLRAVENFFTVPEFRRDYLRKLSLIEKLCAVRDFFKAPKFHREYYLKKSVLMYVRGAIDAVIGIALIYVLTSPGVEPVTSWLIFLPVIIYASCKKAGTVKQKIMFGVASAILLALFFYLKSFL